MFGDFSDYRDLTMAEELGLFDDGLDDDDEDDYDDDYDDDDDDTSSRCDDEDDEYDSDTDKDDDEYDYDKVPDSLDEFDVFDYIPFDVNEYLAPPCDYYSDTYEVEEDGPDTYDIDEEAMYWDRWYYARHLVGIVV